MSLLLLLSSLPGTAADELKQEDGFFILQEDGSYLVLDAGVISSASFSAAGTATTAAYAGSTFTAAGVATTYGDFTTTTGSAGDDLKQENDSYLLQEDGSYIRLDVAGSVFSAAGVASTSGQAGSAAAVAGTAATNGQAGSSYTAAGTATPNVVGSSVATISASYNVAGTATVSGQSPASGSTFAVAGTATASAAPPQTGDASDTAISARYWRLRLDSWSGFTNAHMARIEFARLGGAAYTPVSITATSTQGTNVAANAIDSSATTYWFAANGSVAPQYLTLDYGSAVAVNVVRILGRNGQPINAAQVEYSTNNVNWFAAWSWTGNTQVQTANLNAILPFPNPAATLGRRPLWRISATTTEGLNLALAEVELRATIGGADLTPNGRAFTANFDGTNPAANAFDNNTGTFSQSSASTGTRQVGYEFNGHYDVAEVSIIARSGQYGPATGSLQYSADGVLWLNLLSWSGQTFSDAGTPSVFNLDPFAETAGTSQGAANTSVIGAAIAPAVAQASGTSTPTAVGSTPGGSSGDDLLQETGEFLFQEDGSYIQLDAVNINAAAFNVAASATASAVGANVTIDRTVTVAGTATVTGVSSVREGVGSASGAASAAGAFGGFASATFSVSGQTGSIVPLLDDIGQIVTDPAGLTILVEITGIEFQSNDIPRASAFGTADGRTTVSVAFSAITTASSNLLQEIGDRILQEDGSGLLLEPSTVQSALGQAFGSSPITSFVGSAVGFTFDADGIATVTGISGGIFPAVASATGSTRGVRPLLDADSQPILDSDGQPILVDDPAVEWIGLGFSQPDGVANASGAATVTGVGTIAVIPASGQSAGSSTTGATSSLVATRGGAGAANGSALPGGVSELKAVRSGTATASGVAVSNGVAPPIDDERHWHHVKKAKRQKQQARLERQLQAQAKKQFTFVPDPDVVKVKQPAPAKVAPPALVASVAGTTDGLGVRIRTRTVAALTASASGSVQALRQTVTTKSAKRLTTKVAAKVEAPAVKTKARAVAIMDAMAEKDAILQDLEDLIDIYEILLAA